MKELTETVNTEVSNKEELVASIKAKDEEIEVRFIYIRTCHLSYL